MPVTLLTPDSKEALRRTIRALRPRLLDQLLEAAKGEYRLDVKPDKAQLPEARRCRRARLEAWLDEQVRGAKKKSTDALRQRFLDQAIKEAAHTWLNRLVMLRILEQHALITPAVVTGGWSSPAYEQEFAHYAGPLTTDDTRGYRDLLETVFAELSLELPGLFGPVGLVALFPMPASLLREVVEALNEPALDSAWGDDMTLGWIYQYWNDPEREALDAKIADGGKIEPHEIASKTQMFTERYMVEWLLENSLGLTWLCICKKNGWTADADQVLPVLDQRRAAFRQQREAGEVPLDALMPLQGPLENAWKYYVPQPIPEDAVLKAPSSIRDVKLLDPACGSGHFLVSAFGLFVAMYAEEARHRGEPWSNEAIAESILANNLHGIDIDPRAIQIAAAALWLKAKLTASRAKLARMNLVAPTLKLGHLPDDDPSLIQLRAELKREAGIPEDLTRQIVGALAGVDHLGTLLKVDAAVEKALGLAEREIARTNPGQGNLFTGFPLQQVKLSIDEAKANALDKLEQFLSRHSSSEDLGLRLDGEQLASGVRFVRMVKEGTYDVVVGNPPYQGLSKTAQFEYVTKNYPRGKVDLYAAFLERGIQFCRDGGCSALITIRGWMFLGQFQDLRLEVLAKHRLVLGDLGWGAFEDMTDNPVTMSLIQRGMKSARSIAMCPTDPTARVRTDEHRRSLYAGLLAHVGRYEFDPKGFAVIEGEPIVYWWTKEFLARYAGAPKLGDAAEAKKGLCTCDDVRFVRSVWELGKTPIVLTSPNLGSVKRQPSPVEAWVPAVNGAEGRKWIEPVLNEVKWSANGLEIKVRVEHAYNSVSKRVQNEAKYFVSGIAFSMIGASCTARMHRAHSLFLDKGSSVFTKDLFGVLAMMNGTIAANVLASLNPTVSFQVGDVNRLPIFPVANSDEIFATIDRAFTQHESHREPSVEFKSPGPSPWRYAQDWAQSAVDRPEGAPLPPYIPEYDEPAPQAHVSFAIGVALGRFGANHEGILDVPPDSALPAGILFVGPNDTMVDSLTHPATAPIVTAWDQQQSAINNGKKVPLRDWLRKDFFTYHKALYENRPIYFPLSSEKRSFVALVSIHRWADNTLQTLLAEHLNPALRQLEGEIADLNQARASSDKKTAAAAEKQYGVSKRLIDELLAFIGAVTECAERGAPPTDPKCPKREVDALFHMDLDDGVMINSAALWPLLEPQWKDPKKWWKELCAADGRKDYDWAHLARRYFPERVDEKCKVDPSLAVAHGCFWKYHPAKAYAWELRLQDEIGPDFVIEEDGAAEARKRYLKENAAEAKAAVEKEMVRRERKAAKADAEEGGPTEIAEGDEDGYSHCSSRRKSL